MKLKEISKDIYDVDAWLDESLGKEDGFHSTGDEQGSQYNFI